MRILEYAWNTLEAISKKEYDSVRLVLDEKLQRPVLGDDGKGYFVKLPVPRKEREGLYSLHGLYADSDEQNWAMLWRIFRASIYHAAFHILYSDVPAYVDWAKGRDKYASIYAIALVEDYKITAKAQKEWTPLLPDIAYANFVSALRMKDPDSVFNESLRAALKLLLEVWGLAPAAQGREDAEVIKVGNRVRSLVQRYTFGSAGKESLLDAASAAYDLVNNRGILTQIPSLPHTEAHSGGEFYEPNIIDTKEASDRRQEGAYEALGIGLEKDPITPHLFEARDALRALIDLEESRARMTEHYGRLLAGTRLQGIRFPPGDIGSFMRTRMELAGPIRNVREQLRQVRNVLDENPGEESGQVDMAAAMQVIASKQVRQDVFVRDQLMLKDEVWAILVDASKSTSEISMQLRGITACLAEVAKDLMKERSRWAVYGFNDYFHVVKDFDEPYSIEARARIGGLFQEGPTYLPDALLVASKALGARPVDSKYLVVVSDCLPTGYQGIEKELEEKIKLISRSGIMLLGVGVQSSAVTKYFAVNCVMTTPYELMKFFVKGYIELSSTAG